MTCFETATILATSRDSPSSTTQSPYRNWVSRSQAFSVAMAWYCIGRARVGEAALVEGGVSTSALVGRMTFIASELVVGVKGVVG